MDMQLRLLDRQNAFLRAYRTDDNWHHLGNADADITWRHQNPSLKVAQRDLCPGRKAEINFLQLADVILFEATLKHLVKQARDRHFLKLNPLKLVASAQPTLIRKPLIDLLHQIAA